MQIYHGGREAITAYQNNGRAVAPSVIAFDFLEYPVEELTHDEILEIVKAYGQAAQRAYEADFDGVEIHGANHYLIQQFFSAFSNLREDEWGGSLEKRMAFPLAVTTEVKRVVSTFDYSEFIVGYRISPEEVHGETVGYDYKESLKLVKHLVEHELDYLHISNFGTYDMGPNELEASYADIFKEAVGEKLPVITVASVFNEADVEGVLAIADIVAIGRAALLDPQFTDKLVNNQADEINHEMSPEVTDYVKWPKGLYDWYRQGVPLPPVPNIESVL